MKTPQISVSGALRSRVLGFYGFLGCFNAAAWAWAVFAFHDKPVLLGTAILAYTFGLRHAVDADHIAAIDNVTRKLLQENKRPLSVGFFFSLGHSTIVVIASLVVYLTAAFFATRFEAAKSVGEIVGTSVSAFFLVAIALVNIVILRGLWQNFREVRKGGSYTDQSPDMLMRGGGIMARIFRPLLRMISRPWHMYPIGILFGLGFDTATEVALLGISAAAADKGLSVIAMAAFPILFTAGMTLVDTTDGILMVGAYGWAFVNPIRKMYYNLTITFISVIVALLVGGIEIFGLLKDQLKLTGGFWDIIGSLNENFGTMGFVIVGILALSWMVSVIIYRFKIFDQINYRSLAPRARLQQPCRLRPQRQHNV
ncbi:MAG TPA: HoxN/HupN/NixA family nickel/cobalt transporter [Chthoniobacterales bacterium]|nr:HoxN/HupN/NixA family nickel/cobalt transporter [Chthoniobacterales bacterium]